MTMHEKQERNNNNTNCTRLFFVLFYCILPLVEEEHVNLFSWIQFFILFFYLFCYGGFVVWYVSHVVRS
jgi:hypothetical protein